MALDGAALVANQLARVGAADVIDRCDVPQLLPCESEYIQRMIRVLLNPQSRTNEELATRAPFHDLHTSMKRFRNLFCSQRNPLSRYTRSRAVHALGSSFICDRIKALTSLSLRAFLVFNSNGLARDAMRLYLARRAGASRG